MNAEKHDGQTHITWGGIEWKVWFTYTTDGDEIVEEITYVEIAPVAEGGNGGWIGDRITIDYNELPESVHDEIDRAAYSAWSEYLMDCAEHKQRGYEE